MKVIPLQRTQEVRTYEVLVPAEVKRFMDEQLAKGLSRRTVLRQVHRRFGIINVIIK